MSKEKAIQKILETLACDGILTHSIPYEKIDLTEEHLLFVAEAIVDDLDNAGLLKKN